MKKGFIILTGDNEAKDLLQEKLKKQYWVWKVSTLKYLRHNATALGWDWEKLGEGLADEFIHKMLNLANEYLDYEYNHIMKFMQKTLESTKAQENKMVGDLLLVEANKELSDRLLAEYDFHILNVNMGNVIENNFEDDKFVLGMGDTDENISKSLDEILNLICFEKAQTGE